MAEIARRCRLSKATVSRALSLPAEQCPLNPKTRQRVIQLATGLGYRPNWRARAFSMQKTRTVGLITAGLLPQHEAIPHQILEAFTHVLRDRGYHLALVPIDGALDWRDLVFGGHIDGCATINDPPAEVIKEIAESNLPVVAMNARRDTPLPVVTVDDFQGGRELGTYLSDLGHHQIAMYVNGAAQRHYSQLERLRGLTDGLNGGADEQVSIRFVRDTHDQAMPRLLDDWPLPTAIVCYSHYEVIPLLRELWKRGISVPDEVSVVAFNDVFPLDVTNPPLTTVSVPAEQIGAFAAESLLEQITAGAQAQPSCKVFQETLVIRDSCAAARPAAELE